MSNPVESTRDPLSDWGPLEMGLTVVLMLFVGAAGWWLAERPVLEVDATRLAALPERIGPWKATDVALETAVEQELRADYNLQRLYLSSTRDPLLLYVGYYGTHRGGRPEHNPQGCYTGAGWAIDATRTLRIGASGALRANEFALTRGGERQLVVFWYRSYRRTGMLGGFDQNVDRLFGMLWDGRADGALVRLSTPIFADDVVGARSRLQSFASLVDPLLASHWPSESACSGDALTGPCAAPAHAARAGD